MVRKPTFLTEEGRKKISGELEHIKTVRRTEIAERIQGASDLESTVNNAEYDDAKNEQAFNEGRILTLEATLSNASIVRAEPKAKNVAIGSTVTLRGPDGDETYTIVGSVEANPLEGKISNESPVGQALLGRKVGESVEVKVPSGVQKLKVVRIK